MGDQWVVIATVLGTASTIAGLLWTVRRSATKDAQSKAHAQVAALDIRYNEGVAAGRRQRDDEVALMRSQRDDARTDRDLNRATAERWESRYLELRDRRSNP